MVKFEPQIVYLFQTMIIKFLLGQKNLLLGANSEHILTLLFYPQVYAIPHYYFRICSWL